MTQGSSFQFLHFEPFEVLGDVELGKEFLPPIATGNNQVCLISPRHGRAVTMKISDLSWINIKGIGWTFGGPYVYRSRKDQNMMFGLLDECDAKRELQVSEHLQKINPSAPKVLEYKRFKDINFTNQEHRKLVNICHTCGKKIEPSILYTQMKSPFRMADIAFFTDSQREEILNFYCNYFNCSRQDFIKTFAFRLAKQIGLFHAKGIINDSLYWDNITLCAEIVDYEWLTVPGMLLPNGQDAEFYIPDERKEKEIIYAIEAILRMAALFHLKTDFYEILSALVDGHKVYNPEFIERSDFLLRMQNREKFIY